MDCGTYKLLNTFILHTLHQTTHIQILIHFLKTRVVLLPQIGKNMYYTSATITTTTNRLLHINTQATVAITNTYMDKQAQAHADNI